MDLKFILCNFSNFTLKVTLFINKTTGLTPSPWTEWQVLCGWNEDQLLLLTAPAVQSAPLCEVPAGGPHLQLLAGIPGVTALIHPGTPPPRCLTPAFACGLNVFRLCLQKPLCQRKPADALSSLLCYFLSGFLFFYLIPDSQKSCETHVRSFRVPAPRSPVTSYPICFIIVPFLSP